MLLLDVLCCMFTIPCSYLCVGSVVGLFICVGWSLVDMFGGWLGWQFVSGL